MAANKRGQMKGKAMGRLLRFLFMVALIALLGAVGYVALVDVPPPTREIVEKVPHDVLFPKN